MNQPKTLISIIGPTAVGKTALSIAFAKAFSTSILSCDSRQLFKEMRIGTAVPTTDELQQANHYFIQNKSILESYSVGDYEKEAIKILDQLFEKQDIVIMVGGSMLYEKAITHGLDQFPDVPQEIIVKIEQELKEKGLKHLQKELLDIDPEYYHQTDISNPRRLTRAISIYRSSGIAYSSLRKEKAIERHFKVIKIGLEAPREELYHRINTRVDQMLSDGLLDEVQTLYPHRHLRALQTVGYQEFFPYLDGNYDLEEAIRLVKRNSRRFAKRQMTWYRKDESILWFPYRTRHSDIIQRVQTELMDSKAF